MLKALNEDFENYNIEFKEGHIFVNGIDSRIEFDIPDEELELLDEKTKKSLYSVMKTSVSNFIKEGM